MAGLVFKSVKPLNVRKHVEKEKPPILICCDFLESNKVAGVNEAMQTIGITPPPMDDIEQKN